MDKAFIDQMQKKVEQQLGQREIDTLIYWKDEVEKLLRKKPDSLTALLQEVQQLHSRMENRLSVLKRSASL
jgi:transposase